MNHAVLSRGPSLPMLLVTKLLSRDFHVTIWDKANPSGPVRRTLEGKSAIDRPTVGMCSISKYGGSPARSHLVDVLRHFRYAEQSIATRQAGLDALKDVATEDVIIDDSIVDGELLAVYFNSCVVFGQEPSTGILDALQMHAKRLAEDEEIPRMCLDVIVVSLSVLSRRSARTAEVLDAIVACIPLEYVPSLSSCAQLVLLSRTAQLDLMTRIADELSKGLRARMDAPSQQYFVKVAVRIMLAQPQAVNIFDKSFAALKGVTKIITSWPTSENCALLTYFLLTPSESIELVVDDVDLLVATVAKHIDMLKVDELLSLFLACAQAQQRGSALIGKHSKFVVATQERLRSFSVEALSNAIHNLGLQSSQSDSFLRTVVH